MSSDPNVRVRVTAQNEVKSGLAQAESDVKSFSSNVKSLMTSGFGVAAWR